MRASALSYISRVTGIETSSGANARRLKQRTTKSARNVSVQTVGMCSRPFIDL